MIPDFQTIMLPLLDSLKEGDDRSIKQTHDALAAYFELNDDELNEEELGNDQTLFNSRILLAMSHLLMADLLQNTNGLLKITPLGKQVLSKRLNTIDTNYLRRFPGYIIAASK